MVQPPDRGSCGGQTVDGSGAVRRTGSFLQVVSITCSIPNHQVRLRGVEAPVITEHDTMIEMTGKGRSTLVNRLKLCLGNGMKWPWPPVVDEPN